MFDTSFDSICRRAGISVRKQIAMLIAQPYRQDDSDLLQHTVRTLSAETPQLLADAS